MEIIVRLTLKLSKKNKYNLTIDIKEPKKIDPKLCKKKFDSLTLDEKYCFLFLMCCVKAKKVPIIQGETASGKSFLIKLFAEIMGQTLNIYQLNDNSGMSIFTGQSIMNEDFDKNEKEKYKEILKLFKEDEEVEKYITTKYFYKFEKKIEEKLKSDLLSEEEKKKYEDAKNTLSILKSPLNRFTKKNSELISSLEKGNWIALDGLEMANTLVSEKISSLCDEPPTLNVYESGNEDLNFGPSKKIINDNFRLFIIYNPNSLNAKKIDRTLFNKCIKFILEPIDFKTGDAELMLYNRIIDEEEDKSSYSL